jgi:hypothetical protein
MIQECQNQNNPDKMKKLIYYLEERATLDEIILALNKILHKQTNPKNFPGYWEPSPAKTNPYRYTQSCLLVRLTPVCGNS